jgi:hypothetical protein
VFLAGHWGPEMVRRAGGVDVLGVAGAHSATVALDALAAADPEVVVVAPCGYDLARAAAEARALLADPRWAWLAGRAVWAVDANAYVSRPGPRLVDGVELFARVFHPDRFGAPPSHRRSASPDLSRAARRHGGGRGQPDCGRPGPRPRSVPDPNRSDAAIRPRPVPPRRARRPGPCRARLRRWLRDQPALARRHPRARRPGHQRRLVLRGGVRPRQPARARRRRRRQRLGRGIPAPRRPHLVGAARGLVRARRWTVRSQWREARVHLDLARSLARFFDGRAHHFVPKYFEPADSATSVSWPSLGARYGFGGAGGCDIFLKMDIEGAEYRTLEGVLRDADRIAGAAVEFHDLDSQWDRFAALMDAMQGPFAVAHLHGNNCAPLVAGSATPTVVEVSFVNRRLLGAAPRPSPREYPVPGLDMPNEPSLPDYPLAL